MAFSLCGGLEDDEAIDDDDSQGVVASAGAAPSRGDDLNFSVDERLFEERRVSFDEFNRDPMLVLEHKDLVMRIAGM